MSQPRRAPPAEKPVHARNAAGRPICGAKRVKGRGPCQVTALMESGRCRVHGGAASRARRTHGLTSRSGRPASIQRRIEQLEADPAKVARALDHKAIAVHLYAVLDDALDQLEKSHALTAGDAERLLAVLKEMRRTATDFHRLAVDKRFVDLVEAQALIARSLEAVMRFVPDERRREAIASAEAVLGVDPHSGIAGAARGVH